MYQSHQALWEMIEKAQSSYANERRLCIQTVEDIGQLEEREAATRLGLTLEELCKCLNMSMDSYWKRLRVYRLFKKFPGFREMFERGETELSHLGLIARKVSEANAEYLREAIKGKFKREVANLVRRIKADGSVGEDEGTYEFFASMDEKLLDLINQVRSVAAHSGKNPSNTEILEQMAELFLKHKDPMKKAERAEARAVKKEEKKIVPGKVESPAIAIVTAAAAAGDQNNKARREPIPAHLRHAVFLRDKAQCTFHGTSGQRCSARSMLELDHIVMVCRGGKNTVENLRLRCKYHNRSTAAIELGPYTSHESAG